MIRAVLAVVLAAALIAVATGVLDPARRQRSDRLTAGEVGRLADAVRSLDGSEAPAGRRWAAARRVVDVTLPTRGLDTARVSYVSIGGLPDRSVAGDTGSRDVIAYRVAGAAPVLRWVPVDLRVLGSDGRLDDDDPLVLRGSARVVFSLLRRGGRRVVVASRGG